MTRPLPPLLCALLLGTGIGAACETTEDLRPGVLRHVARELAEPTFVALADAAGAASARAADLCAAPSAGALAAARAAWSDARAAWAATLPFTFGPVAEQMQKGPLDFWPARPDTIEAALAAAPAGAQDAHVDAQGTSAKGLPALEYLLFGEDPAAVLPALSDPTAGPTRCAYALALARDIDERSAALASAWSPEFADALAEAGETSLVYPTVQLGLDEVTNNLIEALSLTVKTKLDGPLGNLTGAAVDPDLLESRFSGRSQADLERGLAAAWAVYHGAAPDAPAAGLSLLVAARDAALDVRVRDQHARALAALAAIPAPLAAALVDARGAVQLARDEIDALRRLIKLDVASLLGVTLSLTDNDGD